MIMKFSIAPISTNLSEKEIIDFYSDLSKIKSIERVYIGEIYCQKRDLIDRKLFLRIKEIIEKAGK
ncbi:MAG: hypothetical protein KAS39_06335, partial [Actinomycetia bacterium]|nr:hypothetical protein [Actinomycetes bacterium]